LKKGGQIFQLPLEKNGPTALAGGRSARKQESGTVWDGVFPTLPDSFFYAVTIREIAGDKKNSKPLFHRIK